MTREELDITRWRGFSHAELYRLLHAGPGAVASAVPAQRWAELASTLSDVHQDLTRALERARDGWRGKAANAAFAQLDAVAQWAGPAAADAATMRGKVEEQADHIGRARAAMPAPGEEPTPQPDPATPPVQQVVEMGQDHEPVERATAEAARRAFEVMKLYQDDTTEVTDSLATFEEIEVRDGHYHGHHRDGANGIRQFPQHTAISGAFPGWPGGDHTPQHQHQQHHHHHQQQHFRDEWRSRTPGGAGTFAQQGIGSFFVEPDVETRRPAAPPPLQQGAMTGAAPVTGLPGGAARNRDEERESRTARKGLSTARSTAPVPTALDADGLPAAAAGNSPVAPVSPTATTPTSAGAPGGDRPAFRRTGESLLPANFLDDAVEPAGRAGRRRDQHQDVRVTENVDGDEGAATPPVIGSDPYRP